MGGDTVNGFLLKTAGTVIKPALLHLVNLSIRTGSFTNRWKFQLVVPHYKKGSRFLPDNYRPVSHLIAVGKLVELATWEQLMAHCVERAYCTQIIMVHYLIMLQALPSTRLLR